MVNIEGADYFTMEDLPGSFCVLQLERPGNGLYRAIMFDAQHIPGQSEAVFSIRDIAEHEFAHVAVEAVAERCGTLQIYLMRANTRWRQRAYWQPDAISLAEGAEIELMNLEEEHRLQNEWIECPDCAQAECMLALIAD